MKPVLPLNEIAGDVPGENIFLLFTITEKNLYSL